MLEERSQQQASEQKKFAEKLFEDKKSLANEIESLVQKMNETDRKNSQNIEKLKKTFSDQLKKEKDSYAQREKQWKEKKLKELKEQTLKGLEPELQRLYNENEAQKQTFEQKTRELEAKFLSEF